MIVKAQAAVRQAEQKDRRQLTNLLHFETQVHRHLDWRPPLDWIGHAPYLVAEVNNKLIAALACPPDPPEVAWVRMFVTNANTSAAEAWKIFWPIINEHFSDQTGTIAAAIPMQEWFSGLLAENNFEHIHDVVMLKWESGNKDIPEGKPSAAIRSMRETDLEMVAALDAAAFGAIWYVSLESLWLALQQSVIATVAKKDGKVVGYQISTPSPEGAHLARLAVHPDNQNQGIGYALLTHLMNQMHKGRGRKISVNTQDTNLHSLALYKKAGFTLTGESYPVYTYKF
ncbi:MAG: GNAT family N-acetyltransferase [Chloroflexi bacterium]|nr:GNAT family N-acetyltransferase [Chloroflexota bacterium]